MSKKAKRMVCNQDLKLFAESLIAKAKNSDRAVFRLTEDDGAVIHVTYKDIPMDSANYLKAIKAQPQDFWGVYNTKIRVSELVQDLSVKS